MRTFILLVALCATAAAQPKVDPKPDPDAAAIRATALDYIEG